WNLNFNLSLVTFDHASRDRQPEAGAPVLGRVERLEGFFTDLWRHARALIDHIDAAVSTVVGHDDINPALTAHRLCGVHQDILNDHLQHLAIAGNYGRAGYG